MDFAQFLQGFIQYIHNIYTINVSRRRTLFIYYFIQIHGIVDGEIKENATIGASENYNADVVKEQMIPELKRRHRYGKTFEVAIIAEENVSEKTYFDAGFSNWNSILEEIISN